VLEIERFDLDDLDLPVIRPLLQPWYDFRDTRAARRVVEWILDESLIGSAAADRFFAEHPDPPCPDFIGSPAHVHRSDPRIRRGAAMPIAFTDGFAAIHGECSCRCRRRGTPGPRLPDG
jgi:hypothetical protein